ncbi:hypothetical protein D3C87_1571650 [compost metagenome]
MQRKEASLAQHLAVKVDIHVGGLAQILGDIRLPVRRINKIDDAERDIADLPLIRFAKQPPTLGGATQAVHFFQFA